MIFLRNRVSYKEPGARLYYKNSTPHKGNYGQISHASSTSYRCFKNGLQLSGPVLMILVKYFNMYI